jgi:hypothetical protein
MLASANVDLEAGAQFDTLARATAAYQVGLLSFPSCVLFFSSTAACTATFR